MEKKTYRKDDRRHALNAHPQNKVSILPTTRNEADIPANDPIFQISPYFYSVDPTVLKLEAIALSEPRTIIALRISHSRYGPKTSGTLMRFERS